MLRPVAGDVRWESSYRKSWTDVRIGAFMNRRSFRNATKRALYRVFRLGQRAGFDLLPRHFYSSVPDINQLSTSQFWRAPLEMVGVNGVDLAQQLAFASACCTPERRDRVASMNLLEYGTRENGEIGYGAIEADFLYCFIQAKRPSPIVQVGAGFSTAIILRAASDAGYCSQADRHRSVSNGLLKAAARRRTHRIDPGNGANGGSRSPLRRGR